MDAYVHVYIQVAYLIVNMTLVKGHIDGEGRRIMMRTEGVLTFWAVLNHKVHEGVALRCR